MEGEGGMTGASKRKGDSAEREAAQLLYDLLGVPARRKRGGTWRIILTPEAFATLWREAQP